MKDLKQSAQLTIMIDQKPPEVINRAALIAVKKLTENLLLDFCRLGRIDGISRLFLIHFIDQPCTLLRAEESGLGIDHPEQRKIAAPLVEEEPPTYVCIRVCG